MPATDIGIDLGSSNVVIYAKQKGITILEPSVVAYDKDTEKILAYGEEAQRLIDRTQGNIVAIRPLRNGVISDYRMTELLLKHFIQKALGRRAFKRAVEEASYQAGARDVTIVEETVAAAIGAGIDITKPVGNLVVDIGGATTKCAVISLGAPVVLQTLRIGGDTFSEAIVRYVRRNHNLFIGEGQAEAIKIKIGTVYPKPNSESMQISGRNVITGLPRTISITSDEVRQACGEAANEIVEVVHGVLEKTPPELSQDIVERGIILTGGGALLDGFEEMIEERTGINAMTAEHPECAVAEGTGLYNEKIAMLSRMD